MPVQAIAEQDEESDRIVLTLRESKASMTELEMRRYERNMCPADLYDDERVAPI